MEFVSGTPSCVISIRQRDLLNFWLRLHVQTRNLPAIEDYNPDRLEEERQELIYYRVENSGPAPSFRILNNSSRISLAYSDALRSSDLERFLGPERWALVSPAYLNCVKHACPVYATSKVEDANGRSVQYERLLLPFGHGNTVTQVIASLKTISEDGSFTMKNLLGSDVRPTPVSRVLINRDLTPPAVLTAGDGDISFD